MPSFTTLRTQLLSNPAPLLPPPKPLHLDLTPKISALSLHPTLEVILHLLNQDLPSAHFLVRHMQSAPAYEGMFLHGILHRIEGDYDNARAWYSDVSPSQIYTSIWGSEGRTWKEAKEKGGEKDQGQKFLDRIQKFKERKKRDEIERDELEDESRREIEGVLEWCVERFGTGRVEDARSVWVRPSEEVREMGEGMVSGGEGRREF